jgi:hypothetical protein
MALATSTLDTIRTKVRRLTRSPSEQQLSTSELDQYINTFIAFDFPQNLRLFSLRTTFTFYTQPGVDVYQTTEDPAQAASNPLFDFKNKYIAIHQPMYISGIPSYFTQWRDVFFGQWPQTNQVQNTLIFGDGGAGPFTGVLNTFPQNPLASPPGPNTGAILQNSMIFTALDTDANSMVLVDYPSSTNPTMGFLGLANTPSISNVPYGQINYLTGQFTVTFPNNTQNSVENPIWAEFVPYVAGKPISILYYDNQFTLRPVPDKAYPVQVEADITPTQLLLANDNPQINQWWQYISYGSSLKILQDRMDIDSVNLIFPEFRRQESMVLRTTLTQQANERTTTIYTEGKSYGWGWYSLANNFPF